MFLFNCQFNLFAILASRIARSPRGSREGSFRYVFINKIQVLTLEELPMFFNVIMQIVAGKQGIPINITELRDYTVVVALVIEVFSGCGCSNIFVTAHSEVEDAVVAESQWCLASQVLYFFLVSGEHQIHDVWSLVATTTSGYLNVLNQKVSMCGKLKSPRINMLENGVLLASLMSLSKLSFTSELLGLM